MEAPALPGAFFPSCLLSRLRNGPAGQFDSLFRHCGSLCSAYTLHAIDLEFIELTSVLLFLQQVLVFTCRGMVKVPNPRPY